MPEMNRFCMLNASRMGADNAGRDGREKYDEYGGVDRPRNFFIRLDDDVGVARTVLYDDGERLDDTRKHGLLHVLNEKDEASCDNENKDDKADDDLYARREEDIAFKPMS
jgi:hypothetical protein